MELLQVHLLQLFYVFQIPVAKSNAYTSHFYYRIDSNRLIIETFPSTSDSAILIFFQYYK